MQNSLVNSNKISLNFKFKILSPPPPKYVFFPPLAVTQRIEHLRVCEYKDMENGN